MLKSISVSGWRQFREVKIDLHPRLTILTGANGAGKTTILNLISRHFGWGNTLISTPKAKDKTHAALYYSADLWDFEDFLVASVEEAELREREKEAELREQEEAQKAKSRNEGPTTVIGSIQYADDISATLEVPTRVDQSTYDIQIQGQRPVEGIHIPSHRASYSYQQVQNIPTIPRRRNDVFQHYSNLVRARYAGGHTQWSPQHYMKETLIALATFGYGNQALEPDAESAKTFEDFQVVLKKILPKTLLFDRLVIRVPEVILKTGTGDFSIDALSGGTSAVIDLAWQIFMFQPTGTKFVVTLDEPENHLHPELQRLILGNLLAAFPTVQFVVATHSPFIVGSVPDSSVYVLRYDDSKSVISDLLDTANKAGTANEILREVLGLDVTMPVWVELSLEEILRRYSTREFTQPTLTELRSEMNNLGLATQIPETISRLAAVKDSE